jgi:hypothetical protein
MTLSINPPTEAAQPSTLLANASTNPRGFDYRETVTTLFSRGLQAEELAITEPIPRELGEDLVISFSAAGAASFAVQANVAGMWLGQAVIDLQGGCSEAHRFDLSNVDTPTSAADVRVMVKAHHACSRVDVFAQART